MTLDGSGSTDPNGLAHLRLDPDRRPAVTSRARPRSSRPSPPHTAGHPHVPARGEGRDLSTRPHSVGITVTSDVALLATATASSQNTSTGQTAAKAIDGVVDGYAPGDYTKEWATVGGGAGSWLTLTWSSPVTRPRRPLRPAQPERSDHVGHPELQQRDADPLERLPNAGSGLTVYVPDITTTSLTLTVNSVSATTQNVGLAEIQAYPPAGGGGTSQPVASAGAAQSVASGATVTLDGSGSSDPNGNPLTYHGPRPRGRR